MAYSISSAGDDCYPGTTVLVNKLNIQEQAALDHAEEVTVTVRMIELRQQVHTDILSFSFYRELHRRLFSDLYIWAGELRTIDITKKGTSFCPSCELQSVGDALFQRLADKNGFASADKQTFVDEITDFYHDLNMLHPFREGNGRTQRLYFMLLIERAGYRIDFSAHDPDELIIATIYAAQGVMEYLRNFFEKAIEERE